MDSVQIISKVVSRKREGAYIAPSSSSGGGGGTTIVEGDKSASVMLMKLFTPLAADDVEIAITDTATEVKRIRANFDLFSVGDVSANGIGDGSGEGGSTGGATTLGGLVNVGLWADEVPAVDRIMYQPAGGTHWTGKPLSDLISGGGEGYATKKELEAVSTKLDSFLTGTDTDNIINKWVELEAFLSGMSETSTLSGLLQNKADKTITISAGTGLSGGGDLSANRTLSLAASGVSAGTYTKVTVDVYGRVTGGTSLAAGDIPGIPWSKITSGKPTTLSGYGITDGINSVALSGSGNAVTSMSFSGHSLTLTKGATFLEKATFDDLFEKVNVGTSASPVYAIKAKYTFYSVGDVVAKGIGDDTGSGTGGTLAGLVDVSLSSPANGQYLMYNGSHWVNSTVQQGLDTSAMWNALKAADTSNVIDISHIPNITWSKVTGKPTTLSGYGITDAYTKGESDGRYVTALGTSGNYLTWTKNGTANNITVPFATNADLLDGYHESSFLRFRGSTDVNGEGTLWSQIGIKQYNGTHPDGLPNNVYHYGAVISLASVNARLDIWYNHQSSYYTNDGIQYRSGWDNDKKPWRMILDSVNYTNYADGRYVNVTGDTMTGDLIFNQSSTTGVRQVRLNCGDNDHGRIAVGATGNNAGWMEIATADDGNEPIYARQYTGVFTTITRTATLLDGSGNTQFPGTVQANYFTCRNTTLCTNLNADLLDGLHQNSFLRVGGENQLVSLAGSTGNTTGWRLVIQTSAMGGWQINGMTLLINSRHQGTGIISLVFHTTNAEGTSYAGELRYYGSMTSMDNSAWRAFYNPNTKIFRLFWRYSDYSNCQVSILNRAGLTVSISNGTWYTSLPSDIGSEIPTYYNVATQAHQLYTARTINGTSFNGSTNITTSYWGTARTINGTSINGSTNYVTSYWGTTRAFYIRDYNSGHTGGVTNVNGSSTYYLYLPSTINASLSGNASTATTLQTSRTINGTSFNGSANITTSYWGTVRNLSIQDSWGSYTGTATSVNGSANYNLKLPSIIRADSFAIPNRGSCYFRVGGGDNANEVGSTTTSNIEINSWNGVTFTTTCGNQTYTNKVAMSVNCRTGRVTANNFHAAANITANGDVIAKSSSSDIRLKKDIRVYDAMSIIRGFRSVKYRWNDMAKANSEVYNNDHDQYGLIAQDLMAGGFGQWVKNVFNDYYTVSYERLIPVLWKGVQEVDSEVAKLRKRVEYLENEIKQLRA